MRIRKSIKYGTTARAMTPIIQDEETGIRMLEPDYKSERLEVDSLGFRNPELTVPKTDGLKRIAFLGASTTFCIGATSNAKSWPALVVDSMRESFPDSKWDFINAGVPGYRLKHSRESFDARIAKHDPDIVVIYHATNDIGSDTREVAIAQGLFEGRAEDPSWLAEHSVMWHWIELNAKIWMRMRAAARGGAGLDMSAQQLADTFGERLKECVVHVQKTGAVVVLATFAPHLRADQTDAEKLSNSNTNLYYMPYMTVAQLEQCYDAYNEAIRKVASETGCLLADGIATVPGTDEFYVDAVHFTNAGCRKMAERISVPLKDSPRIRKIVARD